MDPTARLGIAIGRHKIQAARLSRNAKGWHVDWVKSEPVSPALFNGTPAPGTHAILGAAFDKLCADVKRLYIPVNISLPDPAASFAVFELDDLPKTPKARLDLVRWRFEKERHLDSRAIACACQPLGGENGKHLLLGLAVDGAWLRCVTQALRTIRVVPWVIDMGICHRFNYFHAVLTAEKQGGALVSLDPEAWGIALWDREGRLRFARARWREQAVNSNNKVYEALAQEVERAIRAYVQGNGRREVARIYITGAAADVADLSAVLDRRLRERTIRLPGNQGHSDANAALGAQTEAASPALAAACR